MTMVVVMMWTRRAVGMVVVLVIIRRGRMMIPIRITDMLNFDAGVREPAVGHQQSPTQSGKNAEHKQPCHESKHGGKKH